MISYVTMLKRAFGLILLFGLMIGCQTEEAVVATIAPTTVPTTAPPTPLPTLTPTPIPTITPTPIPSPIPFSRPFTLGESTGGHEIEGWQLGNGERHLILVSGIHGGAEWNTILLAYDILDHYTNNPEQLPQTVTLTIIPVANPDGQMAVLGTIGRFTPPVDTPFVTAAGRLNANQVDLNRNWDCLWRTDAVWAGRQVSGGSVPFSEVETVLLRDYIESIEPELAIFYHSSADGVYTGQCDSEQHPDTLRYASDYAEAANYTLNNTFSAYTVTGDASDYLNKVGIAAFTIELNTKHNIEWNRNFAAVQLLLAHIGEQ